MFTYSLAKVNFKEFEDKYDVLRKLQEHDKDTAIFSFRVAQINAAISIELGLSEKEIELYFLCGLFHDVGKLGMSTAFLNYEGQYTMDMFNEMKNHTIGGKKILEQVHAEPEVANTAFYHHCNFDGMGYPTADGANAIPHYARVTRISDSVDAYMTKRCYKDGGPAKEALADLKQFIGKSYDPELIEVFEAVHNKVMHQCHANGWDHPSQEIYMHFLNQIYETGLTQKHQNILQSKKRRTS